MNKGTSSTKPGTMGAYKPRRPGMTMDDVMTSEGRATRERLKAGAKDEKDRAAAGRAYDKAAGYMNGGMVKSTPKATPYKCGGMVKGK